MICQTTARSISTVVDVDLGVRARELLAPLAAADNPPPGEVIHDHYAYPRVRAEHDAELVILGLDPDSMHPKCNWCEREERLRKN